ncbi:MAG: HAMP domain-containing histidine kinase [Clostridia bacterium]|nr:HAMP domain-containing histidine kinase [Clostridia bacterium]
MKISFKLKTAMLIALIITLVCAASVFTLISAGEKAIGDELKQRLIQSVERNADEVEIKNGILDIENDFAFYAGGVYCSVYSSDGKYIKGEMPDSLNADIEFRNGETASRKINDENYLVYDSQVLFNKYECEVDIRSGNVINCEAGSADYESVEENEYRNIKFSSGISASKAVEAAIEFVDANREKVKLISVDYEPLSDSGVFKVEFVSDQAEYIWIRGITPADSTGNAFSTINRWVLCSLPLLIFVAAILAYLIAKRIIKPVEDITLSAKDISSGNDLSKRIEIGNGRDEIHVLADTFNEMFERLGKSFENERQFTSDASHELRTPLAVIKGECEFALSKNSNASDYPEAFREIQAQADKMTALVSTLLTLTRTDQKSSKFVLEPNDISILCEEVCADFRSDRGISIKYDIEKNIVMNCEPVLICRLLENLLTNSVKYGKENGETVVKLYKEKEHIILSIADNGIGMTAEEKEKAFNRFYRADSARSGEGFGLGLSLVSKIAELHGGTAVVESEKGKGSEFRIIF